jgi:hypothetical protein
MREEYGETSSIYRSRVLAEFPEDVVEGLIRRDWLRAAFARWESGELEGQAATWPHSLAFDPARFGPDESVLCHIQGPVVRGFHTWRNASLVESAEKVIEFGKGLVSRLLNPKWEAQYPHMRALPTVFVDEPGVGGGAIDVLESKGYPVEPFNGSNKAISDYERRYHNLRAQSHWRFRELLEKGEVALPPDSMLEEEALAIEWTINPMGKIQILGKDTLRSTLGRSPDRLDSVVIGLAQGIGQVAPTMTLGTFYS